MKYEYEVLKLGDADAIFIRHYVVDVPYIVLIDAGNVEDWAFIKAHLWKHYHTYTIDLAICTHPDNDHMGGFFGLLQDDDITITEFWLIDPAEHLDENDIKRYRTRDSAKDAVRQIFNHPTDVSQNLIKILLKKLYDKEIVTAYSVVKGHFHSVLPIEVVAPTSDYYGAAVRGMIKDCNVHPYEPADTSQYDEAVEQSIGIAKSSIDGCGDDPSPYNQSSIVLLYKPEVNKKVLFASDATRASLVQMIKDYPEIKDLDVLKVPHHGSKHNLNSHIIDTLKPKSSYISAIGSRTHPSVAIVNYLSKHGDVFSTHKHNGFIRRCKGIERPNTIPISPLKAKQNV
jgi:hypothetical protein